AKNQPKGFNCGSVFKNPTGFFAGKLIEDLGLKGTRIGGAEISSMHANFLVSDGTASHEDILELISFIKNIVFEKYGIKLEEEINIIFNTGVDLLK
ncbi:MAG: UDP-N-acetylmuramate dehydrogenase, partial [Candidatus Gracilibacteria bacterium]|nr:UDP-N-acetylmuramate dehydrogenase [Candidatus Gracilibacteria bacterium]